jgi:hypothetical protein
MKHCGPVDVENSAMANYLERVAFSAARKAAVAKPPSSGPPVMPAGREFLPSGQDTFAADEDEFVGASAPEKANKPVAETDAIPSATPTVEAEPAPKPATTPVSLKNEAPFTVHLPKTLRPIAAEKVPPSVPEAPTSDRVAPAEPPRIVERSEPVEVVQSVQTREAVLDKPPVTPSVRSEAEPVVKKIYEETVVAEPPPVAPRVREVVRNKIISTTSAIEPLTVAAEPRQAPAVVVGGGIASRPEPSRISIGQFEVLVNNQPPTAPAKPPAAAPVQSSNHLERRYLDRFRLRR